MTSLKTPYLSKKVKAIYFICTFLLLSFGVYGSITHYPLRWSEAFFSKNNTINQFALNPVLNFFDSFAFRNEGADNETTKAFFPVIASYLNIPKDSLSFERKSTFDRVHEKKPNLVIVMLESLGVVGLGSQGNIAKATPYMDSIINKSTYFTNFYVHKPGTAASVFSSITGLADVDNQKTASRNSRAIDQKIIFDQFDGYEKLYFLGGSANWANIRGVFQSNINNLKIYEEGSYEIEDRADVWGIDDYDLFKESDKVFKDLHTTNKPFVAYVQTATNHRPFSVPDNKESYRPLSEKDIDEERDIRKKKIAYKEELAKAKNHLDGLKSKYYEEIKAGSKLNPEQQKAVEFFNRYKKENAEAAKLAEQQVSVFKNKTEKLFSNDFKGFDFNVGEKKFRFKVNNVDQVKDEIYDIFMSIEVEEHEQRKKSEALKQLEARRGIEKHFEKKRLVEELDDYSLEEDINH